MQYLCGMHPLDDLDPAAPRGADARPRLRWAGAIMACVLCAGMAEVAIGQAAANTSALQACPTVKNEIADLDMLVDGLKHSDAVGLFEKVRLNSAVNELIARLKAFHGGTGNYSLAQLQEQYDLLMMRIATQLQDKDITLHSQLCNAWEPLWTQLQDRGRFNEMLS